jgi:hypothetical protein
MDEKYLRFQLGFSFTESGEMEAELCRFITLPAWFMDEKKKALGQCMA